MSIEQLWDQTTDPDRPFTGQPHTDAGERGKTEVKGIRFRDLADCVVKALVDVADFEGLRDEHLSWWRRSADDGTLRYRDALRLNLSKMGRMALVHNICCRVEKAMGIYPNVPHLRTGDSSNDESEDR